MSVDHQRLNLTNRERYLRLLPEHLCDVYGGKRSVIGKIQSFFIVCLTVEQSCELVTITETELDLEPCPVNVIYIFAADRGIGREIQSESATGQVMDYQPDFLLQRLTPCHKHHSTSSKASPSSGAMSSRAILLLSGQEKSILPSLVLGRPLLPVRGPS